MRVVYVRRNALAIGLALAVWAQSARAGELDVEGWLARPGVKLLAVEFYATWCKPCMEAVPKWKALHEKYRKLGLRLVVVATQDPQARCGSPGWTPDELVCDLDGTVAERFGAKDLPSAFLWGWQGHQLATKGRVEDVEAAIESWMREAPRVEVEVQDSTSSAAIGKAELRELVLDELARQGKLQVVASGEERAKLAEIRKRSFEAGFDDNLQCELGKELSANSLLAVSVVGDAARPRLAAQLRSAESGCLSASAVVDLDVNRAAGSVAEALAALIDRTRTQIQLPGAGAPPNSRSRRPLASTSLDEKPTEWRPDTSDDVLVSFASTPPGAVVTVDGDFVCQGTPCRRALRHGEHSVVMQKERYAKRSERVVATANAQVEWMLEAAFGLVSVTSVPSGLPVSIDGEEAGRTPLRNRELDPGTHEVWVEDRCYLKTGERFGLAKGESKELSFSPVARESAIEVMAEDADGNSVDAEVYVDGQKRGTTPGTWSVRTCSSALLVSSAEEGLYEERLDLKQSQTQSINARLESAPAIELKCTLEPDGAEGLIDRRTGLYWSVPKWGYGINNWKGAGAFCAEEQNGNRLPTIEELIDVASCLPRERVFNTDTLQIGLWSSTKADSGALSMQYAWVVRPDSSGNLLALLSHQWDTTAYSQDDQGFQDANHAVTCVHGRTTTAPDRSRYPASAAPGFRCGRAYKPTEFCKVARRIERSPALEDRIRAFGDGKSGLELVAERDQTLGEVRSLLDRGAITAYVEWLTASTWAAYLGRLRSSCKGSECAQTIADAKTSRISALRRCASSAREGSALAHACRDASPGRPGRNPLRE
ncbi:MAG: PEGA domain-containing protein [Deltaproteobacteria bacterium]|nr:PEGA domain-containing protein [Deltaproteobacteria bacterium]